MHVPAGIAEIGVKLRRSWNHGSEGVDETSQVSGGVSGVIYFGVNWLHQAGVTGVDCDVGIVTVSAVSVRWRFRCASGYVIICNVNVCVCTCVCVVCVINSCCWCT